jgi:integrase
LKSGSYFIPVPKYQDLVFTTTLSTPIVPRGWDRIWQRLVKNANVPKVKFHALRHFHGSYLLTKGFTEVEVSERQGHSPKVFKSVYAHTFEARRKSMAESLDKLGKLGKQKTRKKPVGVQIGVQAKK